MAKYSRNSILKSVKKTSKRVLPSIDKGLKTVGTTAKDIVEVSVPVVEKGVSAVYGTMATGFDLGVKGIRKGAKTVAKGLTKRKHSRRHKKGGKSKRRRH